MLKPFYNWLRLKLQFLEEAYYFWLLLCRHNASVNTEASMKKMQYILLREAHVIEKGMSMRNPRKGFGQAKILIMLQNLIDIMIYIPQKIWIFLNSLYLQLAVIYNILMKWG